MNEWIIVVGVLVGMLAILMGYAVGVDVGLKDLKIREVEIERDMYKQRLQEWKSSKED